MFCKNCGKQLSDTAKFCSGCGTPQKATPAPEQAQQYQQPSPQTGGAGYSLMVNTPEFRQFAEKIKRKNMRRKMQRGADQPNIEMVAEKYEQEYHSDEYGGNYTYHVIFRGVAGEIISYGGIFGKRAQEYYQLGDRCLYHCDIDFFEKYDKSRDAFSFCPFCKKKVALGNTRCTHCKKPLLI